MNIKIVTPQNILEPGMSSRLKLLKIIQSFPGIRYNDLIRTTGFNNGTLSHHLATLEKSSIIKILRPENNNMTRYFSTSITKEESIIIGFLKIKSTSQIINMLIDNHQLSFLTMDGVVTSCEKALEEYRESVNNIKNTETRIIGKVLNINACEAIL